MALGMREVRESIDKKSHVSMDIFRSPLDSLSYQMEHGIHKWCLRCLKRNMTTGRGVGTPLGSF